MVEFPFSQGEQPACAHVCLAVGAALLLGDTNILMPPTVVLDEARIQRALRSGMVYHEARLAERRRKHPKDMSAHFTAGEAVTEHKRAGWHVWYNDRSSSGWVLYRAQVPNDHDTDAANQGCTPRLVDEVAACHQRMRDTSMAQLMILTCGEYTRLALFRCDGLWAYDSHRWFNPLGHQCSRLFWFATLDHLAVHLLDVCGVRDQAVIVDNLRQMRDPSLRAPDCVFDNTRQEIEFEIVVLERKPA